MEVSSPEIDAQLPELFDESLGARFESRALDLFRFQYSSNSPYRAFCDARGLNAGLIKDWTQIPAVTTSSFKDFAFSCLPVSERTHVFHSSGTTEQRPSRHFHSRASLQLYETSLLTWFERFAIASNLTGRAPLNLICLTPPTDAAAHSSLVYMFETIRRKLRGGCSSSSTFLGTIAANGSWSLDMNLARAKLAEACEDSMPIFLFGTAFLFVHLLDSFASGGIRFQLPRGSMVLETGGYKGRSRSVPRPELHALICDTLGVEPRQILCEYGMCELSSQAYAKSPPGAASGGSRIFQFPPWARSRVISPENGQEVADGEAGLLRICDLANAWSVCAIQTEDLAIRRGAGFELLGRAETAEPRGCSLAFG